MIKQALIFAGGLGTRLRSVVSDVPKPMAPVGNRPFLDYLISYWATQGIQEFTLSIGYKGECIKQYFGGNFAGAHIRYVEEDTPLGTGGALALALRGGEFGTAPVLLLNGDTWFEASLQKLEEAHESNGCMVTVALRTVPENTRYGGVVLDKSGHIAAFGQPGSPLINAGSYLFSPSALMSELAKHPEKFSLEQDVLPELATNGHIGACIQDVNFIDIGIPEDYERFVNTHA